MPMKPAPMITLNGKPSPNPRYNPLTQIPKVYGLAHYGNVEHIRFAMKFQEQDRKLKNPQANRYGRTVDAICKQFNCGPDSARNAVAALVAYRMACFTAELPGATAELVDDFRRIAQKAELEKDYSNAISARREIGKIVGIYAPLLVEVKAHSKPQTSLQDQLRAVIDVLSPQARAGLELALGELETARLEGRLKLASGDDEESAEGAVMDAEASETASSG